MLLVVCRLVKPNSRIEVPALVIGGEDDSALSPKVFRGIEHAAPNVQLHILPNCSHWVQQDRSATPPHPPTALLLGGCTPWPAA